METKAVVVHFLLVLVVIGLVVVVVVLDLLAVM